MNKAFYQTENYTIILGAGMTGLSLAYRLSQRRKGQKVIVLEAAPRTGGLVDPVKIAGKEIEATYHHLFPGDTEIIELCAELGILGLLKGEGGAQGRGNEAGASTDLTVADASQQSRQSKPDGGTESSANQAEYAPGVQSGEELSALGNSLQSLAWQKFLKKSSDFLSFIWLSDFVQRLNESSPTTDSVRPNRIDPSGPIESESSDLPPSQSGPRDKRLPARQTDPKNEANQAGRSEQVAGKTYLSRHTNSLRIQPAQSPLHLWNRFVKGIQEKSSNHLNGATQYGHVRSDLPNLSSSQESASDELLPARKTNQSTQPPLHLLDRLFVWVEDLIGRQSDLTQDSRDFGRYVRSGIIRNNTPLPCSTPFDLLALPDLGLLPKIRLGLTTLFLQKLKNWEKLKGVNAYDWLKKYAGEKATEYFFRPLLEGKFGPYYKDIDLAWLWARFHTRSKGQRLALSQDRAERLIYPYKPDKNKSKIKTGFIQIISALEDRVRRNGGEILYGKKVQKIMPQEKQVVLESGEVFGYSRLVVTLPNRIFLDLLAEKKTSQPANLISSKTSSAKGFGAELKKPLIPEQYQQQLTKTKYLGAICILFATPQSLSSLYWHSVQDPESPFQAFIQHTNLVPKSAYNNQHVYYLGKYLDTNDPMWKLTDDQLKIKWFNHLKKIFPQFSAKQVTEIHISRHPFAQHVPTTSHHQSIPGFVTPFKDIFLANFSQIYPYDRGTNFSVQLANELSEMMLK